MIVTKDKYTVLELTESDVKALRALALWAEMLEEQGKLEIYSYQREFIDRIKNEL